ncbi:conserved hypothetical protein [Ricinus communis]|uniref:FAD/NAD(P)-binding domain-containing protein n=1 Tax=Ricinus communis TaxID=3988 RepID=B9RKM3_RICCO|nr:conserved hypothetical protein [Ricinus communis]
MVIKKVLNLTCHQLHVCVVGSGPAGFYTAEKMLKAHQEAEIDIIDRLPTPFGLVRSSVAPDHPETKVVLAYGAESDRALDIPGEGNVALEFACIILQPTVELARTDIACHALAALEQSSIRKVYLVGRRGPVRAACTAKELREVLGIKDLFIQIKEADLLKSSNDERQGLYLPSMSQKPNHLGTKVATSGHSHPSSDQRELHFVFFQKPDRFLDSEVRTGHVAGIGSGKQVAVGTGKFEDLDCGMVLKSIGYKSVPVDGLPFDHQKGVVPSVSGLVLTDASGDPRLLKKGLYVASISDDLEQGALAAVTSLPKPGREGLLQLLDDRNVTVVPFSGWQKIDFEEKRLGSSRNKPREKLTS